LNPADVTVRVAGGADARALADLRARWSAQSAADADFAAQLAAWLAAEGERRTIWLAHHDGAPAGMASMLEYRRMPKPGRLDSRWGYLSNLFVVEPLRGRGVGSALLDAVVAAADARGYVRLVLSPSADALPLYARAGFVVPDGAAGDHRLLVRAGR